MTISSSRNGKVPRVKRTHRPPIKLYKSTYAKALPFLKEDFCSRCAYSMVHEDSLGGALEVDHFDPRKKLMHVQDYENLFPASRICNGSKRDTWPSDEETSQGLRLLNCCEEADYGEYIFEDPLTHELVGTSPAAIYHIEVIGLNHPWLISRRRERSELFEKYRLAQVEIRKEVEENDLPQLRELIEQFSEKLAKEIPEIPAPPQI